MLTIRCYTCIAETKRNNIYKSGFMLGMTEGTHPNVVNDPTFSRNYVLRLEKWKKIWKNLEAINNCIIIIFFVILRRISLF